MVSNQRLWKHLAGICEENGIGIHSRAYLMGKEEFIWRTLDAVRTTGLPLETVQRSFAYAIPGDDVVCICNSPLVWADDAPCAIDIYTTAMHEVGHLLSPEGVSSDLLAAECSAWEWAITHAIVWTEVSDLLLMGPLEVYFRLCPDEAPRFVERKHHVFAQSQVKMGIIGSGKSDVTYK